MLIRLEGLPDGSELALPKAVQRDAIKGSVEHVDLILVRLGEKVTVDIPLELYGALVPQLVLQPLVENAIVHGIGKLVEGGEIRVTARAS